MSYYAIGAMIVSAVYSSNEQSDANDAAISASREANETSLNAQQEQDDRTRSDTGVVRETGDNANMALGMMLGVRSAPSSKDLDSLKRKLDNLQAKIDKAKEFNKAAPRGSSNAWFYEKKAKKLQEQRKLLKIDIDRMKNEISMAGQFGADGEGNIPDLNSLMEGVELPKIDDFLNGVGKDLENSQFYQFELQQGRQELENILSGSQNRLGGNAMKAAIEYGQNYASSKGMEIYDVKRQEALDQYGIANEQRQQQINNLFNLSNQGQGGQAQVINSGQNYATEVGRGARDNARVISGAAEAEAGVNTSALSNIVNTGMTLNSYNNMMNSLNQRNNPITINAANPSTASTYFDNPRGLA